jgi:hypothetical protein
VARNANLVLVNAREVAVADASASLVPANAREVANLVLANAREVAVADASANLVLVNAREVVVADAVNYKKY